MDGPTLKSLVVRDFRSIAGEWTIPLNANVILIHGPNGAGKTSLLSALELAATGRISYLDRIGDEGYRSHLLHRGAKSGQVRVETTRLAQRDVGSALVTAEGTDCQPLFDGRLQEAFIERCFLPQTTLGRLFEVYAPQAGSNADAPLIRFVKEVLGLDSLDALIDGLYAAGHVRRIEKLSTAWQEAKLRRDQFNRLHRDAVSMRAAARTQVERIAANLEARLELTAAGDDRMSAILAAVETLAAAREAEDVESSSLHEVELRLDAVEATLVQADLIDIDPNQSEAQSGLAAARARFDNWIAERSQPLRSWYEASGYEVGEVLESWPGALLRALRSEIAEVEDVLLQLRRRQDLVREVAEVSEAKRQRLDEVERSRDELAEARSSAATGSAAASLASVLVSVLEHVDGEVCPVCDQDFLHTGSLRDHIVAKASTLNADAERLLEMEARRSALDAQYRSLTADLAEHARRRDELGDPRAVESELQARTRRLADLRSLEPIAEAGLLLATEVSRSRDVEAASVRGRALLERCLTDLNEIAETLSTEAPRGLLGQRVAALRALVRERLNELEGGQRELAEVLRLRRELAEALSDQSSAEDAVEAAQLAIANLSQQVDEASRRKDIASSLRKAAETLRTATITSVFDDHLNGSWARIFGALAPSEPFVPRFKHIPDGSRQVTVDIETVHHDGTQAATPAAMLSQGNLNTAALSLFVALHFAVPAELPWLIFDDPVQSMDDLHVSNFAAMVKQLSRRYDRQVVIAVHERELFDYLALELTPASPEEQVLKILLDRTYGRTTIAHSRLEYHEDNALTPSPAA